MVTITIERVKRNDVVSRGTKSARLRKALGIMSKEMATEIEEKGRRDIAAGGNFKSSRWQEGFKAKVWFVGIDPEIRVTSKVPYFMIFEKGGTIKGKPLLWIPLSFAKDAQGVSAKDFPDRLFRVDRKNGGNPLLLSVADKKPKYVGLKSVRIPKKFHIVDIVRGVARTAQEKFRRAYAQATGSVTTPTTTKK